MIALFLEDRFPTLDTSPIPAAALKRSLASVGPVESLGISSFGSLNPERHRLLVLPYGSAFPKEGWPEMYRYFQEGGNLLVLGGRPFERPVHRNGKGWRIEGPQTAYHQTLGIEQWNEVPAGRMDRVAPNLEEPWLDGTETLPTISHSPMVRLTDADEDDRLGSAGPMDRALTPLLWGLDAQGRKVACPVSLIDCRQGRYEGGRWVFASAGFKSWGPSENQMAVHLASCASLGALEAEVRPVFACVSPGSSVDLSAWVRRHRLRKRQVRMDWSLHYEGEKVKDGSFDLPTGEASAYGRVTLPISAESGFYRLETRVWVDGRLARVLPQGFWGWDEALVRSAPVLGTQGTRITLDGRDLPVVGTTYMSGDVSRKFITHPNPAVWDRDMAQMVSDGVNLIRTGFWTMHRSAMLDPGRTREDVLRALDAFILCALRHRLPVFVNFFSFIPDTWPSDHPTLDPRALSAQREFMLSLVRRYARIPSVGWDFINEPSGNNPKKLWTARPQDCALEREAFARFLQETHGNLSSLREAWNCTAAEAPSWLGAGLPEEIDFNESISPGAHVSRAGRAFDFQRYMQKTFADWVAFHARVLREATTQLLSVGQDLGGATGKRPSNRVFHGPLDLTTTHSWWENEDLLFSTKAPAVKGKPFLTQETGVMFTDNLTRAKRRTEEQAGRLFERKLASSFMGGAGFIHWCWNINVLMNDRNEVEIGGWRADGSARPEAMVLAAFGDFFRKAIPYLQGECDEAPLAVVHSETGVWANRSHTDASHRASHRALGALSMPFQTLGEGEFNRLSGEKVILFPAVHRMDPRALAGWIRSAAGRHLVVSGPLAQDGYGRPHEGLSVFGVRERRVEVESLERLEWKGGPLHLAYSHGKVNTVDKDAGCAARVHNFKKGKTRLLYQPLPVEVCDDRATVVAYYAGLLAMVGLKPLCRVEGAHPLEATVYPRHRAKTAFYSAVNETGRDLRMGIRDGKFGFRTAFDLKAGRAHLAVYDAKGKCLAAYEPPVF